MFTVFLVIQVIVTLALVGAILIQRSDADGLGSLGGGGGGNALMTGRGQASLLTRATAVLATIFMLNSLLLAIIVSRSNESASIVDQIQQENSLSVPLADDTQPAPEANLPEGAEQTPVAETAPAGQAETPAVEMPEQVPAQAPVAEEVAPVTAPEEETAPAVPQQ